MCEKQNPVEEIIENDEPLFFTMPVIFSTENLAEDIQFDKYEFDKGIKQASCDCGIFTALVNSGISYDDAIAYILTLKNVDMNIKIAEINSKSTVEASKNQQILIEKQQL